MCGIGIDAHLIDVLAGVIVGGIITTGATFFLECSREKRDASHFAHALRGEIKALQTIVQQRKYIERLREVIAHIETTKTRFDFGIRARRDYFNVFRANISKLGALKNPLPERIAAFYVTATAILEDMDWLAEGGSKTLDVESQKYFYSELLQLFEKSMSDASEIVAIIDEKYP